MSSSIFCYTYIFWTKEEEVHLDVFCFEDWDRVWLRAQTKFEQEPWAALETVGGGFRVRSAIADIYFLGFSITKATEYILDCEYECISVWM